MQFCASLAQVADWLPFTHRLPTVEPHVESVTHEQAAAPPEPPQV
jgi:hypothetical protein